MRMVDFFQSNESGVRARSSPSRMPVQYSTSKITNVRGASIVASENLRYSSLVQKFIVRASLPPIFTVLIAGLELSP